MDTAFTKKYLSLSQSSKFNDFCLPLFTSTNIETILYYRMYRDGRYVHFNTNPKLNQYLYHESQGKYPFDYRFFDAIFQIEDPSTKKISLFAEDVPGEEYWIPLYKKFNLKSTCDMVEFNGDYYEGFWFIMQPEKTAYTLFINHLATLERFILSFKSNYNNLIEKNEKHETTWINQNPLYLKLLELLNGSKKRTNNHVSDLKNSLKLSKYPVWFDRKKIYITEAELRCIRYLGLGFSHKETGKVLWVSYRTIEAHLRNVKKKLGVVKNMRILEIFRDNNLMKFK